MIIRERPPIIINPGSKVAYVQNVSKKNENQKLSKEFVTQFGNKRINNNNAFKSSFDVDCKEDKLLTSYVLNDKIKEDQYNLMHYEENLKQSLYDDYLIKQERDKFEKKTTNPGVFIERFKEKNYSHEQTPHKESLHASEKLKIFTDSDTSTYRKIKFSKVTDHREIKRLNEILSNPKSLTINKKSDTDGIAMRLAQIAENEKIDINCKEIIQKTNNSTGSYIKTYFKQE
jgi:hypothetical protein